MNVRIMASVVSLSVAACSPSDTGKMVQEMRDSIKVGPAASSVKPPFGLPLYPGAKVDSSMMNGTAMNVDVESTRDDLAAFYSEALIARGYVINREEAREERVTITASEGGNPASKMAVSVTSYDDPSKFTLVFVKFRTS